MKTKPVCSDWLLAEEHRTFHGESTTRSNILYPRHTYWSCADLLSRLLPRASLQRFQGSTWIICRISFTVSNVAIDNGGYFANESLSPMGIQTSSWATLHFPRTLSHQSNRPKRAQDKNAIRLACGLEHELSGLRDYNEIERFRFWDAGGERPPYHDVGMWRESLSSKMCYCLSAKI